MAVEQFKYRPGLADARLQVHRPAGIQALCRALGDAAIEIEPVRAAVQRQRGLVAHLPLEPGELIARYVGRV